MGVNAGATGPEASRLNLGCGFDHRPGHVDVDLHAFHRPDVVADLRRLPSAGGSQRVVVLRDVLEHVDRDSTAAVLAECGRVVGPGGRLEVQVPDLAGVGRQLAADDLATHRVAEQLVYGTQAYDGDYHLAGFTDLLLADHLVRAGFESIELWSIDGWLLQGHAARRAMGDTAGCATSFTAGWFAPEGSDGAAGDPAGWRWSTAGASVRFINPTDDELKATWSGRWLTHTGAVGTVELRSDDLVRSCAAAPAPGAGFAIRTSLPPGVQTWEVRSDQPLAEPGEGRDHRPLSVGLAASALTLG